MMDSSDSGRKVIDPREFTSEDHPEIQNISVTCECGHNSSFEDIFDLFTHPTLVAGLEGMASLCEQCECVRRVRRHGFDDENAELSTLELRLETVILDAAEVGPRTLDKVGDIIDEVIGTPLTEVIPTPVGECSDCGGGIYDIDYHEGPEAPEIGWEYIQCPECKSKFRVDKFE